MPVVKALLSRACFCHWLFVFRILELRLVNAGHEANAFALLCQKAVGVGAVPMNLFVSA